MYPRYVFVATSSIAYSAEIVNSEDEHKAALVAGFHDSIPSALASYGDNKKPDDAKDEDPPTKDEIRQKATELGIKFDGRTSDKTLLAKIEEKLNGLD